MLSSLLWLTSLARGQELDAERFVPAAGTLGGLVVERPLVPQHLRAGGGLFLNYAKNPLLLRDPDSGEVLGQPLEDSLTFDALFGVGLTDRGELAFHLPIHAIYQGDGSAGLDPRAGVGDLRIMPKAILAEGGDERLWKLGLAVPVSFPTGNPDALRGSGSVMVEPRFLGGWYGDRTGITANLGVRLRGVDPDALVGQELTFGLGTAFSLSGTGDLDLLAELTGAYDMTEPGPRLTDLPLELVVGPVIKPDPHWSIFLAGALGTTDGLGTPDYRLIAGVRYAPKASGTGKDTDGDGIADVNDKCVDVPEDYDGFEDEDGCPEEDNDDDGVFDDKDECPDVPEGKGGDGDGCPDRGQVKVEEGRISITGKIQFATDSSDLDPRSDYLLDEIAKAIQDTKAIKKVIIEGHTDDTGPAEYNDDLSRRRAESVRRALVERGVEPDRLEVRGMGERQPIAPNATPAGRAKNRRVEFLVRR
jgi:OmpA-OmpF porin, OOP family